MTADPRAWGIQTPLPGFAAQRTDAILGYRASLPDGNSAPLFIPQILNAITDADITRALAFVPLNPATIPNAALLGGDGQGNFVTVNRGTGLLQNSGTLSVDLTSMPILVTLDLASELLINSGGQTRQMQLARLTETLVPASALGVTVATLDGNDTLTLSQLPAGISSGRTYAGTWDAAANLPLLVNGTGTQGTFYICDNPGTALGFTFALNDQVTYNGTVWQRSPAVAGMGTMAGQNATSIAVTGGFATGMSALGVGVDQTVPMAAPDAVWGVGDAAGNMPVYIDFQGNLRVANLVQEAPLAVPALVTPAATIAGNEYVTAAGVPDLTRPMQDAAGNVVFGFRPDGTLVLAALSVVGGISAKGVPIGAGGGAQTDALDVTAAPFGAVGDGTAGYFYATTSGATLTLGKFSGLLSLTQLSASTATVAIVGTTGSGIAFQPTDAGKLMYLKVGSYVLQAPIASYIDGETVVINASGITPQALASGTIAWPSFLPSDVGKTVIVDGMGQNSIWPNTPSNPQLPDTTTAWGQQTFYAPIASVVSPVSVTISGTNFPLSWTGMPCQVRWGTDNGNAIAGAGQAAFAANIRKLYFPGNGALYLALGMCGADAGRQSYGNRIATDAGAAINGTMWVGDAAEVFACDPTGLQLLKRCAPVGSEASKWIRRSILGKGSYRRASNLNVINYLIVGDSQATGNPQKQAAAWMQIHIHMTEVRRANPGKTVNFYNCAVGGSTWAMLASPTFRVNDATGSTGNWTVPRPIAGTVPWQAFLTNINQTGVGPPILPDVVFIGENAGNDSNNFSAAALRYVINLIRSVDHGDGFGPADIILQTDQLTVTNTSTDGNTGGIPSPHSLSNIWWNQYGVGLLRSTADAGGFGLVDLAPMVYRAAYGYDQIVRDMRAVPVQTVTATPNAPVFVGARCSNYSTRLMLAGASDAAAWASMGELAFATSPNRGGQARLRLGPNGNIWIGVEVWGARSPATCTIALGGTSLTLAAPTVLTGQTYTQKAGWPQLRVASGPFTGGMVGSPIIVPSGEQFAGPSYSAQRNWIRGVYDANNVMLNEDQFAGTDIVNQTGGTIVIGPAWLPEDSFVCPDVVIFFADGTIWNTQVAFGGYVSQTQATLAAPSPQALTAQSVQLFIGRMMPKWFDTGFHVAGATGAQGEFYVEINDSSLLLAYQNNGGGYNAPTPIADVFMERLGGSFYPVITPGASQQIIIDEMYVDVSKPFSPVVTPWELRGIPDENADYAFGGAGGHPSSRLASNVTGPFYSSQDLSTW